jgi:hypothetical protein
LFIYIMVESKYSDDEKMTSFFVLEHYTD